MNTGITVGKWVGILGVVIGALGLLATFLQAGNFAPAAIVTLVAGVLQLVVAALTSNTAVALKLRKSFWHK